MPEITDELIERLYEKYEPIIRKKIWNYKIRDAGLVDDIVQEIFSIALTNNRLRNINNAKAYKVHFTYYWFYKGLKKVLVDNFGKSRLLKENEIDSFQDKVNYLMQTGYSEEEAKDYVIMDESLRRGVFATFLQPPNDNPNWFDSLISIVPELKYDDRLFIRKSVDFCLKELSDRKNIRNSKRDFLILADIISPERIQSQEEIAEKYNITPERVSQIKKRDFPLLKKCICEYLELDKKWHYDCGELT